MAAFVLAMYSQPADPAAFDTYYHDTHLPLAKKLPGLESYTLSKGPVAAPDGTTPYYLIAQLGFASMAAVQAALGSPEGAATVADTANFAQAGLALVMYESAPV